MGFFNSFLEFCLFVLLLRMPAVPTPAELRHDAATRIQALWRGREVRAKAKFSVVQVGMLRIKAMRHGHSPSAPSPMSPVLQEAQKTFLETPSHSPRTQGEGLRAAVRLQAVFRGNQVRRHLETQRQAATKIQAQFRGRKGRLLAMDLATAAGLPHESFVSTG